MYGSDQCAHCHMTVADPRFAAELVMKTGKVIVFDDIGCLAAYLAGGEADPGAVHSTWAHDFFAPDAFVRTGDLHFVRSGAFHTPMSSGIIAVARISSADSLGAAVGGERLAWPQVLAAAPPH